MQRRSAKAMRFCSEIVRSAVWGRSIIAIVSVLIRQSLEAGTMHPHLCVHKCLQAFPVAKIGRLPSGPIAGILDLFQRSAFFSSSQNVTVQRSIYCYGAVTTTIRLRFGCRLAAVQLRFDRRSTPIHDRYDHSRPTLRPYGATEICLLLLLLLLLFVFIKAKQVKTSWSAKGPGRHHFQTTHAAR